MPVRFECKSELGLNDLHTETGPRFKDCRMTINLEIPGLVGSDRVVRWCWVSFQCRGVLLIWIMVGQGPSALAVGAGGGCLDIFFHSSIISLFFLPLWETARYRPYRLKYCLKAPLNPKQLTNQ